ncbi:uncharacterized protein FOMMEDRAFT_25239 [Fomitiporia mediterranea MF3/22]|uniref:uncharacterized protein n=1 Tax=Fomitiporia mediterranea (strain MF3/22) TaxID=694068 RepID=UPI00044076CD|nr:uncharacterized protein FOMMEDRAFT_25239 [Fomitiporia mediterranea MF3/22]EJD08029.1 hypothetical protein FOMMEDRAFT_25239 [Fomitiporia mediterranea MF3/22]
MSSVSHYALEVRRLEDIQHTSERHRSDIKIKIEIGNRKLEIGEPEEDESTARNDTFTFSSLNEPSILKIRVIENSKWRSSCIASVDLALMDVLSNYADGENPLGLFGSSGSSQVPVGRVFLYVREIDEASRAKIDVKCVEQDIKRIQRSAGAADPADMLGSVVKVVDKIVESIDDIVGDIHPYLKIVWTATTALYKTDKKLVDLVRIMEGAYEFARDAKTLDDRTRTLTEATARLLRHTIELIVSSERILKINSNRKMDEYKERLIILRQGLNANVAIHTASTAERVSVKVGDVSAKVHGMFVKLDNVAINVEETFTRVEEIG